MTTDERWPTVVAMSLTVRRFHRTPLRALLILAVLFGSLRRGVRQGLVGSSAVAHGLDAKLAADEAGVPTWPKARQAFQARLSSRAPREWRAMYTDLLDLERRSRSGAEVDANDLTAFAMRWRRRAPAGRGGRR